MICFFWLNLFTIEITLMSVLYNSFLFLNLRNHLYKCYIFSYYLEVNFLTTSIKHDDNK